MYKTNHTSITKMTAKLDCPQTVSKTFWFIVNRFLNETKKQTIPQVLVYGKLTSDFDKNAELFNLNFSIHISQHNAT